MNAQNIKRRMIAALCAVIALSAFIGVAVFAATYYPQYKKDSDNYLKEMQELTIYKNSIDNAIPQTVVYDLIKNHFDNSVKIPKVLFIGYDGGNALVPALNYGFDDSAITRIAAEGGLYLTYCGGAEKGSQDTSTAPGWAAIFTGVWASENGVYSNGYKLNRNTESIILELGSKGYQTAFSASWKPHFTRTYKWEAAAAKEKKYPISYILNSDDDGTANSMLQKINEGSDAVFGIIEYLDYHGHKTGFNLDNPDYVSAYYDSEAKAMMLIDAVKERETYEQEDWLIIITSDHGGYLTNHGNPSPMETYTFLATNKPL